MELTNEHIDKIIELAGVSIHASDVDEQQLSKLLVQIERKLNFFALPLDLNIEEQSNVLIVDDLELSIYQFTQILKKIGIKPTVARSREEAIAEIKKKHFNYIVQDLYLPDLKDGLSLLEETIKYREQNKQNFKIVVMSGTDNKEIIEKCHTLNIDKFVAKSKNWHDEIIKYIAKTIKHDENNNYSKFIINENIIVYNLNKINKPSLIDALVKDANYTVLAGTKNLIINFEKIKVFDIENASFFTDICKAATAKKGKVVFVSPSDVIMKILEDIYLSDIIPITTSIDRAVDIINNTQAN